jgi:dUTP pyrophosphatase
MKVKIKLEEGAIMPKKANPTDTCYDCYAWKIEKQSNGKIIVDLGFSATPPEGYAIRLIPRSSLTKHFWCFNNSIGIGDLTYQGNYKAVFTPLPIRMLGNVFEDEWTAWESFPFTENQRCVQMEIYKIENFEFEQVQQLEGENRGGGFGSSGLN